MQAFVVKATIVLREQKRYGIANGFGAERGSKGAREPQRHSATARRGVRTNRKWFRDFIRDLGFTWDAPMHVGEGSTTIFQPVSFRWEGWWLESVRIPLP